MPSNGNDAPHSTGGAGLTYDRFAIGQRYVSAARTVTESDVVRFAGLSGDFNPLHTDAVTAAATPFGERIAHGLLVVAIASGLANQLGIFEGTTLALMEQQHRYLKPVRFGDTVHLELVVESMRETSKPDRGIVVFKTEVHNQDGEAVIAGPWTLMMRREPAAAAAKAEGV